MIQNEIPVTTINLTEGHLKDPKNYKLQVDFEILRTTNLFLRVQNNTVCVHFSVLLRMAKAS